MKKILSFLIVFIFMLGIVSIADAAQPYGSDKPRSYKTVLAGSAQALDATDGASVLAGLLITTSGTTGDQCTLYSGTGITGSTQLTPAINLTVDLPTYIPLNVDIYSVGGGDVYVSVTNTNVDVWLLYY